MPNPVIQIKTTVIVDNTGTQIELPGILTYEGVYQPLIDYFLQKKHSRSASWRRDNIRALILLFRYLDANPECFRSTSDLLSGFINCIIRGTADTQGYDPSKLYWRPFSRRWASKCVQIISDFSLFLVNNGYSSTIINPIGTPSSYEAKLATLALRHRKRESFLGHLTKQKKVPFAISISSRLAKTESVSTKSFDEESFSIFFQQGLGGQRNRKCAVRDQLITLMMHGAGLRLSETLHLWIQDVVPSYAQEFAAQVRIYHPSEGKAPQDSFNKWANIDRGTYLKQVYGIAPRNEVLGKARVGWKGMVVEDADNYIKLYWFPTLYGKIFQDLWQEHLYYLAQHSRKHPFAFISYSKGYTGVPYSLQAFRRNYCSALQRVGLTPSRKEGKSPHAHRHSYGRRLVQCGLEPAIVRRALHHSSLSSQSRYTTPSGEEVSERLTQASRNMSLNQTTNFDYSKLISTI